MHLRNNQELGFFNIKAPSLKPSTTSTPAKTGGFGAQVGTFLTNLTNLGQKVVEGKQAWTQAKTAWKGTPYALPTTPQTAMSPNIFAPAGTEERLTPPVAAPSPQPATSQNSAIMMTSEEIRAVQRKLNQLGYNSGAEDGIWGPITAGAVTAYTKANNITSKVGPYKWVYLTLYDARQHVRNPTAINNNPSRPVNTSTPQAPRS